MAEGIGFAIPINEARKAAEELRAGGSVKRGYLGISMNNTGISDKARAYYKLPDNNGVIVADVDREWSRPPTPDSRRTTSSARSTATR